MLPTPTSPDSLLHLLHSRFELDIAPPQLDYLVHAFFEQPWIRHGDSWKRAEHTLPRDCVVWANRGGGKTFLGALATMLDLVHKPGIAIRILGGSLEQSRRMHEHLAALFDRPDLAPLLAGRITQRRIRLANGSHCEILAQSETSVRGTRVQKLRCDEVELFDPDIWRAAQLVTRSRPCAGTLVRGSIECLSTMHVPYGLMADLIAQAGAGTRRLFRWGVHDVLERCPDDRHCRAGQGSPPATRDCPLWNECQGRAKSQHPGHYRIDDAIDAKGRIDLLTWESEMLCLRPRRTDTVYPEFDPLRHTVTDLPADHRQWTWLAGMDFGFRAPTVILRAGLDPRGVLWIVDESSRVETVLDRHIEWLKDDSCFPVPESIGVDPAGAQRSDQTGLSNMEHMRRAGLNVRSRSVHVPRGIALVRARLRPADDALPPRLLIHERCRVLIQALTRYRYPPDDRQTMLPLKDGHDHAADALRYLIQTIDQPFETAMKTY